MGSGRGWHIGCAGKFDAGGKAGGAGGKMMAVGKATMALFQRNGNFGGLGGLFGNAGAGASAIPKSSPAVFR